jgi:hypothetical protein
MSNLMIGKLIKRVPPLREIVYGYRIRLLDCPWYLLFVEQNYWIGVIYIA